MKACNDLSQSRQDGGHRSPFDKQTFTRNLWTTVPFKVLQYTGGHNLFSIGRRRSPAVSTADIPLVSQGAFFQHIHASEPEHRPAYNLVIRAIVKIFKRELLVEINYNRIRTVDK